MGRAVAGGGGGGGGLPNDSGGQLKLWAATTKWRGKIENM